MLEETSDLELVKNLKSYTMENDSLCELMNRHSGIFYDIVNRLSPPSSDNSGYRKDLFDNIELLFYNASLRFDESKGTKFSTFIGNETKWFCLNHYNKSKRRYLPCFSIESVSDDELKSEEQDIINPQTIDKIFEIIRRHPDKRVEEIFRLRYLEPQYNKLTPWKKISKKVNLSIQGCINIHNQALPFIKKHLSPKNEFNSICANK